MFDYLDKISSAIYGKAILQYLSDKIDKEEEDYLRSQIKELKECLEKKHWTIK